MFYSHSGSSLPGLAALVCAGLAVSGCQSGNPLSALDLRGDSADAQREVITVDELRAFCPSVALREDNAIHRTYERGGDGDPSRVVYQASIAEVTRSCRYNGPMVTANVAVAGRVVPGPRGQTGAVTLPIRVTVMRGSEVVYSQLHQHQVQVADVAGATQFVFNDPNVTFEVPPDRGIRILAGLEESGRR
jgi:hypothetical protein